MGCKWPSQRAAPTLAVLPHPPTAGGLLNEPRQGQKVGHVVMGGPDTFGLPPRQRPGERAMERERALCVGVQAAAA